MRAAYPQRLRVFLQPLVPGCGGLLPISAKEIKMLRILRNYLKIFFFNLPLVPPDPFQYQNPPSLKRLAEDLLADLPWVA